MAYYYYYYFKDLIYILHVKFCCLQREFCCSLYFKINDESTFINIFYKIVWYNNFVKLTIFHTLYNCIIRLDHCDRWVNIRHLISFDKIVLYIYYTIKS